MFSVLHQSPRIRSPRRLPEAYPAFPPVAYDQAVGAWLRIVEFVFVSANEWMCPPGWYIENRRVADDMWFCVLDGHYSCRSFPQAEEILLEPGDMYFIPRGEIHAIRGISGNCRMASVHCFVQIYGMIDFCPLARLRGVFRSDKDAPYAHVSQLMAREHALKPVGWQIAVDAGLKQVLLHMLRHRAVSAAYGVEQAIKLARLQPALKLIDHALDNPDLRVADLAATMHLSEVALRRRFKDVIGLSPNAFLRRRRIDRACSLLRIGAKPIKEIAAACGFRDLAFFYRVFRSETGTTPARYPTITDI